VSALDPLTYFAVLALVALISLFSVFVPAKRATRVRPMEALRAE
jgi:ABC-type lipoprotein release transport system permease subunit